MGQASDSASTLERYTIPTISPPINNLKGELMNKYHPYDLFGQIPVLESDLYKWVEKIAPHIAASGQWRIKNYIKQYNVPAKVQDAKATGRWYTEIDP